MAVRVTLGWRVPLLLSLNIVTLQAPPVLPNCARCKVYVRRCLSETVLAVLGLFLVFLFEVSSFKIVLKCVPLCCTPLAVSVHTIGATTPTCSWRFSRRRGCRQSRCPTTSTLSGVTAGSSCNFPPTLMLAFLVWGLTRNRWPLTRS